MLGRALDDTESVMESIGNGNVVSVNMGSGGAPAEALSTGASAGVCACACACGFCVDDGSLGRMVDGGRGEEFPVHDEPQKFRELGIVPMYAFGAWGRGRWDSSRRVSE
jgi:hypothetical protein